MNCLQAYDIDWTAVATFLLAIATFFLALFSWKSAKASEAAVKEMQVDRKERNKPKAHLIQHRSEGWPFSLDYLLYLRIDEFHRNASEKWKDLRWNIIIIRNVRKGETGPGEVSSIKYDKEKGRPNTIKEDDLQGFELRSILPGESYAKLFAVQERDPEKEDTPWIEFTYKCRNIKDKEPIQYPPEGKKDWFLDVHPETNVRIVGEQDGE